MTKDSINTPEDPVMPVVGHSVIRPLLAFAILSVGLTAVFWWVFSYASSWWLALAVLTTLAVLNLTAGRR